VQAEQAEDDETLETVLDPVENPKTESLLSTCPLPQEGHLTDLTSSIEQSSSKSKPHRLQWNS